jgi:hypothetical protein
MQMAARDDWLLALRRYLVMSLILHLIWEILQLPLYTLWSKASIGQQVFAVVHCTLGDTMIAALSLMAALIVVGQSRWPSVGMPLVWLFTLLLGVTYTIYSEWLNVNVRGSWAYAPSMPTVPIVGTGLSPLLQWLVVPTLALWFVGWSAPWNIKAHSNGRKRLDLPRSD